MIGVHVREALGLGLDQRLRVVEMSVSMSCGVEIDDAAEAGDQMRAPRSSIR